MVVEEVLKKIVTQDLAYASNLSLADHWRKFMRLRNLYVFNLCLFLNLILGIPMWDYDGSFHLFHKNIWSQCKPNPLS